MPRRPRCELPDGYYHVTARSVFGAPLFVDDDDRTFFLGTFGRLLRRLEVRCHAYCLMGTHYHLLLECSCALLSATMYRLNWLYARRFNLKHERRGHLFDERYAAWVVVDEAHLEATSNYILENPVRAGLCASAHDWPWSWHPVVKPKRPPARPRPRGD